MKTRTISIALLALICSVIAVTPPARAQDPTTLATFNTTDGADPMGDVTQIGTTLGGGANGGGPVFSVPEGRRHAHTHCYLQPHRWAAPRSSLTRIRTTL